MSDLKNIAPIHARCMSEDIQQREIARSTFTHKCKHLNGHEGSHRCICDRTWETKKK